MQNTRHFYLTKQLPVSISHAPHLHASQSTNAYFACKLLTRHSWPHTCTSALDACSRRRCCTAVLASGCTAYTVSWRLLRAATASCASCNCCSSAATPCGVPELVSCTWVHVKMIRGSFPAAWMVAAMLWPVPSQPTTCTAHQQRQHQQTLQDTAIGCDATTSQTRRRCYIERLLTP